MLIKLVSQFCPIKTCNGSLVVQFNEKARNCCTACQHCTQSSRLWPYQTAERIVKTEDLLLVRRYHRHWFVQLQCKLTQHLHSTQTTMKDLNVKKRVKSILLQTEFKWNILIPRPIPLQVTCIGSHVFCHVYLQCTCFATCKVHPLTHGITRVLQTRDYKQRVASRRGSPSMRLAQPFVGHWPTLFRYCAQNCQCC